jgi:hypothetical protein
MRREFAIEEPRKNKTNICVANLLEQLDCVCGKLFKLRRQMPLHECGVCQHFVMLFGDKLRYFRSAKYVTTPFLCQQQI